MRGPSDFRVRTTVLALFLFWGYPAAALADPHRELSEGNALKRVDACGAALERYATAMEQSEPGDGAWQDAAYNRAVCLELLERFDEAERAYTQLLRRSPSAPARADARFRRGVTRAFVGRRLCARLDFQRAARSLSDDASRRRVDVQLGSLDAAEGHKLRAVKRLGEAVVALRGAVDSQPSERWYLAQALVGLGDLHRGDAARPLPRGTLRRSTEAIEERAAALARAQGFYMEAAEQRQAPWTAAAGWGLAQGYLALGRRLLDLRSAPGHLSAFDRAGLIAWIDAHTPDLYRKARDALLLCVDVHRETGLRDRTVRACEGALATFPEEGLRPPAQPAPK